MDYLTTLSQLLTLNGTMMWEACGRLRSWPVVRQNIFLGKMSKGKGKIVPVL
jgi:hypothetical protein